MDELGFFSSLSSPVYSAYIHKSRYARWLDEENRRERWDETVRRYVNFIGERIPEKEREPLKTEIYEAILSLQVMPSMRALMTAGKAAERDEVAMYNCCFIAVNDPRVFDEILYILACGTGVGFSVERQFVNDLPVIAEEFHPTGTVIKVRDSRIGWAASFRELISLLYCGHIPAWDMSAVRPAGATLKTFGGRASGPEPLERLFKFSVELFKNAAGRKLTSIECHDLLCKVADVIVSGGVRRAALISLSNLSDDRMRNAKNGQWWIENGQRALANNSAVYTEKPEVVQFLREWTALVESRSGERGIFNRQGAIAQVKRNQRRKTEGFSVGTNPCGEILLRGNAGGAGGGEFCNLSEIVIRPEDNLNALKKKARIATILGTLQSTYTNFRYLRSGWRKNCEEERLLGVSLTGIMDHPLLSKVCNETASLLNDLRDYVIEINKQWADKLGINQAAATTCVKPSGSVSALVDSSSGIHPRYSQYVLRTVRNDKKDPLGAFLKDCGVRCEPDVTKPNDVDVFYFPLKSPGTSKTRSEVSAIEQLEIYKQYRLNWAEHTISCTVYVKESEWLEVAAWVYKNFDLIVGISFLPYTDHIYQQAPFNEISQQEYEKAMLEMPKIRWHDFQEKEDQTKGSHELACTAGVCELSL